MQMCSFGLLKWILFIYNAIFAILGLALLITAAVVLSDLKDLLGEYYGDFAEDQIKGPAGLMVFVGLVIFVVAAIGALAAIRENKFLILTFAGLITFLVILEFAGSIAAYAYRNDVADVAAKKMLSQVVNRWWDTENPLGEQEKTAWENMQTGFKCCGVHSFNDFKHPGLAPGDSPFTAPPESCCPDKFNTTTGYCAEDEVEVKGGCLDHVADLFRDNLGTIGGFALAMLFIQVMGIVTACLFSRELNKRQGYA